ncbi:MAG: isoprenylcysteine carboxylmethyltransferase family protein [Bacteroidota bacterium]|nr:isoprenylcysteine carboxylmethyltransferase family protein [Bacteroidota bacterium]
MAFLLFITFIICLRLGELLLSHNNAKWLLQNGAIEYGHKHYPFMVALHFLFIISLIVEYYIQRPVGYSQFFLIFYFVLIALKIWIVSSLGRFWNTRIYRIPGVPLKKKGLYAYLAHPNYIIVIAEIAVIPLVFHLYFTAVTFTILNMMMLVIRIREENKALRIE